MLNPLSLIKKVPMFSAFRYRNYRLYWMGMVAMVMGYQIQLFATLWFVYQLTDSPLYLGFVGGATAAGNLGFSLFGGVVADRVDRRRFIMFMQFNVGVLNFALATLALTGLINIWHILIISFLFGVITAFDSPTRQSLIPHLLDDRKDLMSAIAMSSVIWQSMRIFGPVIAALLMKMGGVVLCYYFNSAAYIAMVFAIYKIRILQQVQEPTASVWHSLMQGINFVRKSRIFSILVGATLLDSVFGMSYVYLMPVFARDILKAGSEGFGLLMASTGVGALIGVLFTSSLGGFKHKGWLFLLGSTFFGLFLIFFAQSTTFSLSLILVLLSAISNYIYMITVQTLLQALVSDDIRGRVMSIYALVWSLQPLGSLISGILAQYYGAPLAISLGGSVVCAFSLFILFAAPIVRRLKV